MSIPEIMAALKQEDGLLPEEAMEAAVARREEITPHLLERLREITADLDDYIAGDSNEHLFLMFLLAQFREVAAFPVVLGLLTAAGPRVEELMGPDLDDGLQRVLASICGDDPERLRAMVEDPRTHPEIRNVTIDALLVLGVEGAVPRERILGYLRGWIEGAGDAAKSEPLQTDAVVAATTLGARELLPDIDMALRRGLTIPYVDDVGSIRALMDSRPKDHTEPFRFVRCAVDELRFPFPTDAEEEEWGGLLDEPLPDEPWPTNEAPAAPWVPPAAPGRNDPCSCGSGKKYKKCCG